MQTTVMGPQKGIIQSQMSVEDEGTIVKACVLCAGSLGVLTVLHVINLDI